MGFAATCPGLCEAVASARNSPPKTPVRRQRVARSTCRADGTRPAENDSRRLMPSRVRPTGSLKVAAPFSIRGGCDTEMVNSSCALKRRSARSDIALVVDHDMPSMSPPAERARRACRGAPASKRGRRNSGGFAGAGVVPGTRHQGGHDPFRLPGSGQLGGRRVEDHDALYPGVRGTGPGHGDDPHVAQSASPLGQPV